MADAVRVALLARAGDAREQLRRALIELGAELAAEGDPSELDPAGLAQLQPDVVLISLEPAMESVLDRFEAVLAAPGVQVMFDDAEVTRQLEGWDLARWARHLAAKLVGSDVLPPVPEGSERLEPTDFTPRPGAPPKPSELMDHARLEDYTADTDGLALDVPVTPKLAEIELPAPATLPDESASDDSDGIHLDIDLSLLEQAMTAPLPVATEASQPSEIPDVSVDDGTDLGFFNADASLDFNADAGDLMPARSFGELAGGHANDEAPLGLDVDMEALERSLAQSGTPAPAHAPESFELGAGDAGLMIDLDFDSNPTAGFSRFSQSDEANEPVLDDAVAALAAQLDAQLAPAFDLPEIQVAQAPAPAPVAPMPDLSIHSTNQDMTPAAEMMAARPEPPRSFGTLELALEGDSISPSAPQPVPVDAPASSAGLFAGLSLSLVDENAADPVPGLIVVVAGMGGPDAVRQLLANLPDKLAATVALYQELHNGRFDRLAEQLAKGSRLPVVLGKVGEALRAGEVAVIPDGVSVTADGAGYRFSDGTTLAAMIRAQAANRTAVVVLSGADAALVPDLLSLHGQGALLLAQLPDACFDATAVQALVAAGASAADPAELAKRLGSHWRA